MNIDDYRSFGRARYARFCTEVHKLLKRAIEEDKGYRLQHIQHRAKTVESLSRRLNEIDPLDSENIETCRKDLAGCRIVFYTNNDVNRFTQSGILGSLFDIDWDRFRFHQPRPGEESAAKLFQSYNYVVKLKPDRATLLEYREFEGLYCEIQVQTSLNHAWAEMAHDTIYKRPEFSGFGSRELELIEKRLGDVMRKHLLPAGYHFQRIASDVQRLVDGKALFDEGILDAIVSAENNNDRQEHLVRFKEDVLPHYDDLPSVFPEIRDKLKQAWTLALETPTAPLKTPFGDLNGIEFNQVTAQIAEILERYRYMEPEETYTFIRDLYRDTSEAESREQLAKLAETLTSPTLQVWEQHGPVIQVILAELLAEEKDIAPIAPLAITIANQTLRPDIEGKTWSSDTLTISQSAITYSKALEKARRTVIDVIATHAQSVVTDDKLLQGAIESLFAAGDQPRHGVASPEVAAMICSDLAFAIERITQFAAKASLSSRRDIESHLLQHWRWNKSIPQHLTSAPNVVCAHRRLLKNMIALRETLNADEELVVFKTIVGYRAVFSHMWEDDTMDFERDQAIRREEREKLVGCITDENWSLWKSRLATAAKVKSNDGAPYPPYVEFLSVLANQRNNLALDLLADRENMPAWTIHPLAYALLASDLRSSVEELLTGWLEKRCFVHEIATLIAYSNNVSVTIVRKATDCAVAEQNESACASLQAGAVRHFGENPAFWRDQIFFPCLQVTKQADLYNWMERFWHKGGQDSLISNLTEGQTSTLLEAIIDLPRIDLEAERMLELIASRRHKLVLDWLGQRIERATKKSSIHFRPIPFAFHSMHQVFQPHTLDLLAAMQEWREHRNGVPSWQISHFLHRVYPNLEEPLLSTLFAMVEEADADVLAFIASSLHGYEGREDLLPLLRKVLASDSANDQIEKEVALVICETGVMTGEFGGANTYQAKADMLKPWLEDSNARVSAFATRTIHELEQMIAAENRRGQEAIAMRRLQHGEPI